ncbi:MAG: tetratricopeptide repeat protein [Anaerolineae bacterium]|nr:tetratricopeptide repeat protein [Anaerolineae bacterium]
MRVQLAEPRAASVAPLVVNGLLLRHVAEGDALNQNWMAVVLSELEPSTAEIEGSGVAALLHRAFGIYFQDTKQALAFVDAALELDAGSPVLYSTRAAALVRLGRWPEALRALQTAERLGPAEWASIPYLRGTGWMIENNLVAALADYDRVVALRPEDWFGWNFRAALHYLMGNYAQSEADYARTFALEPNLNFPYTLSTMLALRQGQFTRAQEYVERVLQNFPDPTFANRMTEVYFGTEEGNVFGPTIATLIYFSLGRYEEVLVASETALSILELADLYLVQGSALCNLGDYAAAEAAYDRALELDAQFGLVYMLRGSVRREQGNLAGTLEDVEAARAFDLGPQWEQALEAGLAGELDCTNFFIFPFDPPT